MNKRQSGCILLEHCVKHKFSKYCTALIWFVHNTCSSYIATDVLAKYRPVFITLFYWLYYYYYYY